MRGSVIGEVIEGVVIGCVILFFCQRSGTWHCKAERREGIGCVRDNNDRAA